MTKPARQYQRRMAIATVLYVAAVVGINNIDRAFELPALAIAAISLLPVLPAIMMLAAMIAFFRSMDEVLRRIITEATLIGAMAVGLASFTYGFLEGAMELPRISLIWVLPALFAAQGGALIFVRRHYR